MPSSSAIRPDKVTLAEKIIRDIDKAKPEVVIQMEVLQARTDQLRNLGILPGQSASIAINPNATTPLRAPRRAPRQQSPGTARCIN